MSDTTKGHRVGLSSAGRTMWVSVVLVLIVITGTSALDWNSEPADLAGAYPEWAHYHWVWLDHARSTQSAVVEFVAGFTQRGIPVGAVNIDSEWSTGVNNFVWDTTKFPNATQMIADFHAKNIKVIAWATSMVDLQSPNWEDGYQNGYFLDDGLTAKWWHGWGSFLDYTYPAALQWWHGQMDNVLDIGLDGFKCDGTDAILYEWLGVGIGHGGAVITERQYANKYYGDFFSYARQKNPEALIMSRPVDSWRFIYLNFSPRDVVFSGWVGDQDPTFDGMQDALRNMFHSAWQNYVNFGSDTGGYRGGNRTTELFTRWFQLSTFCPLFENGGEGEHRPWMYDPATLQTYSAFVAIHMELVSYLMTTGTKAFHDGTSAMHPIAQYTIETPSSWDYMLGDSIFVAPIVSDSQTRVVNFPAGNNWVHWFTNQTYQGGTQTTFQVPLNSFTVFKKQGSIIPLRVSSDTSLHGDSSFSDGLTVLVQSPMSGEHHQDVYEWKNSGVSISYDYDEQSGVLQFSASAYHSPLIFLIRGVTMPKSIHNKVSGEDLERAGPQGSCLEMLSAIGKGYCEGTREPNELVVRPGDAHKGVLLHIQGIRSPM